MSDRSLILNELLTSLKTSSQSENRHEIHKNSLKKLGELKMSYRKMPKNGDKLSILGFGCMRLPVKEDGRSQLTLERRLL